MSVLVGRTAVGRPGAWLAVWSSGYAAMVWWASTTAATPAAASSVQLGLLGLLGLLAGVLLTRPALPYAVARVLVAVGWSACGLLVVVVPTNLVMQLVFGAVTDWPGAAVHAYSCAGGLIWGWATLVHQRRLGAGCGHCGRTDESFPVDGWRRPPRWLLRVAWTAWLIPVVGFTLPHWLWALRVPFGTAETDALDAVAPWLWVLGAVPLLGAFLTLGLVQRWGQLFPSRLPLLGGRRVPRWVALVPALAVAVSLAQYGAMMTLCSGATLLGVTDQCYGTGPDYLTANWAFTGTYPVFLTWGLALGITALGYAQLTRARCSSCGRH